MTKNLKISLALVVGAIVVAFIAASAGSGDEPEVTSDADRSDRLVRPDSQLLSEGIPVINIGPPWRWIGSLI